MKEVLFEDEGSTLKGGVSEGHILMGDAHVESGLTYFHISLILHLLKTSTNAYKKSGYTTNLLLNEFADGGGYELMKHLVLKKAMFLKKTDDLQYLFFCLINECYFEKKGDNFNLLGLQCFVGVVEELIFCRKNECADEEFDVMKIELICSLWFDELASSG